VISKILIANRGEIAVRILRACRDLGIPAVAAFSEADRDTLAVKLADEAICIGPAEARRSYLNQPAVISAAMITGCDAIHPGYGFLSEDATFAEACVAHDLTFIGPRPEVLERFASKYAVRRMLAANGLPTVPGSRGIVTDLRDALDQASESGYPVLLKPSAGGGGRGMRLVRSPREMENALPLARSEAQAAFGDDSVYFEKWIEEARHVEVQVMVDQHGSGVHLGERDCSVQRRHQKIIEEGPSPAMDPAARELVGEAHALGLATAHLARRLPAAMRAGKLTDQGASLGKLMHCLANRRMVTISWELAGRSSVVWRDEESDLGERGVGYLNRQVGEIGGGTTEMARNVVSERVLGMPRERTLDRDVPFRDIPKARAR